MCDTRVNTFVFVFHSVHDLYKTQEICDRVVSEESFMIIYCPYRYKTQNMCNKAAADCLKALKLIPDWFVTSKMLHSPMMTYSFLMKTDVELRFLLMKWVFLLSADLDKINLDNDKNVDKNDLETIIYVKLPA